MSGAKAMALDPIYEQCRAKLEAERAELNAAIDSVAGDRESRDIAESLLDNLAEVNDALARLQRGTYAQCETCGRSIANARLVATPAARQCIECAADADADE
jgi:RNA polymerase-binding transcription factor DksA